MLDETKAHDSTRRPVLGAAADTQCQADMETIELGPFVIEVDRPLTVDAYARVPAPGPEECGCWYCRNWVAGRKNLVPPRMIEILERCGIPVSGEIEVWEAPGDDGFHIYGGWYMFVGRIVSRPADPRDHPIVNGWRIHFTHGATYDVDAFSGLPVCELQFEVLSVPNFIAPPPIQAPTGEAMPDSTTPKTR